MDEQVAPSLRRRIIRAGGWTVAGFGISQLIRFGSNLIMARLLVPEMFGVMAIATMVMYGLSMLSDVGLRPSVVQSGRGSDPAYLDTAWVIQIVRGFLILSVGLLISVLIARANKIGLVAEHSVYADPLLPGVIAALSFTAVIAGFESSKVFRASRDLALDRMTQIEIAAQLIGLLCMTAWVLIDRSIWALVVGSIVSALARTLLTHVWLPGVANRWRWDASAAREIFGFGKWIFVSSMLGLLVNSGDRLLLGGLVTPSVLGVYAIAFLIFNSFEQLLVRIIGDISFPALSEIVRKRRQDLKAVYYRFHSTIALAGYFCAGFLLVSGDRLIEFFYDKRYEEAGWMLQILGACLVTVPFRVSAQCLMALGLPNLLSTVIGIRLVSLFVLTPIAFQYFDVPGAISAIAFSHFASLPAIYFYNVKYGLFDLRSELILLPAVGIGMLVGAGASMSISFVS